MALRLMPTPLLLFAMLLAAGSSRSHALELRIEQAVRLPCFNPGEAHDPSQGVPCAVRAVLEDHCSTCHDEVTNRQIKRLDLRRWIPIGDGTYGFPHQDSQLHQRPARETFARILDRITTADPDEAMPLGDTMSPSELKTLQVWTEGLLKSGE